MIRFFYQTHYSKIPLRLRGFLFAADTLICFGHLLAADTLWRRGFLRSPDTLRPPGFRGG